MTRAWFQALLSKLPSFDPAWPADVQAAWWVSFLAMREEARALDVQDRADWQRLQELTRQVESAIAARPSPSPGRAG